MSASERCSAAGDYTMKKTLLSVAVVVLVGIGLLLFLFQPRLSPHAVPTAEAPALPPPALEEPPRPAIAYPLQAPTVDDAAAEAEAADEPLPELDDSDDTLERALVALIGELMSEELWQLDGFVRRVVVTVDNLLQPQLPQRFLPIKPPGGAVLTAGESDRLRLSEENYRRYSRYVRLLDALDTQAVVRVYVRFYPLFQEAYRELGYPDAYFNDRVVEAIDSLLAAPEPQEPIRLVQPSVMYKYADPELEALPAGQKMMIRMGPENAARVKAKLRELRAELMTRVVQQAD